VGVLIIYDIMLAHRLLQCPCVYTDNKKTDSNSCTAVLAVYLLLFSDSLYLHSPSTASEARYNSCACIDMDMLPLVATWAEFQNSVVYYATDQCRMTGSINAEGGHSESEHPL